MRLDRGGLALRFGFSRPANAQMVDPAVSRQGHKYYGLSVFVRWLTKGASPPATQIPGVKIQGHMPAAWAEVVINNK
jgi:hypothetical protein